MSHAVTNPATLRRLERLAALYGPGCFYCGAQVPARLLTVDEYVPRCRGGRRTVENQRPACFPCNNDKGDSDPGEWLARRDLPEPPAPASVAGLAPRRRSAPARPLRARVGFFGAAVRDGVGCAGCVLFGRWAITADSCARCGTRARPSLLAAT